MRYTPEEILQYMREEDVKFIRLAFCDVFGNRKNISVMPEELPRAFEHGIAFDASAIPGFGDESRSDLFLRPDPETLTPLPWRPEHGRVVRMLADITYPDGRAFERDTRTLLKDTMAKAKQLGYTFYFGAEQEFYLFNLDERGRPTSEPCDEAGYMDIAPEDKGENVRREICLTLEQMGIRPESSHHEQGPGQNEIDFRYCDALKSADDAMTFRSVVGAIANRNGATAVFSPKPFKGKPGNGMHINFSVKKGNEDVDLEPVIACILENIAEMTLILNPARESYDRIGALKAPGYITWAKENRSALIRIPAAFGEYKRGELRSPDTCANPYLAFGMLIYAGLSGLERGLKAPEPVSTNLSTAGEDITKNLKKLPMTLEDAVSVTGKGSFVKEYLPAEVLTSYLDLNR